MRKSLVVSPLFFLPAILAAQDVRIEPDATPRVVASATKSARLSPDRVRIFAIVEAQAETPADAAQRADRKVQTVRDAIRALGATAEFISATPYGVGSTPNFNGYPGTPPANPYSARYVVRVQSSRLDQVMNITSALVGAGATTVSPQWEASAEDSVRRAKFTEAVAQARADAESLAASLGMKLGALIEVVGNAGPTANQTGASFINFGRGIAIDGPLPPPEVFAYANVTVRYRLVPR